MLSDRSSWHQLSLGDDNTNPECECRQFARQQLPGKHFMAVFHHVEQVSFSTLPAAYRDHPLFVVDEDCDSSRPWQSAVNNDSQR